MGAIETIQWDGAPGVVAWRYPNVELRHMSQLVVKEAQEAVLVKDGEFYGPVGPGRHPLETKNLPFLTRLASSRASNAAYAAEVWFVQKSIPLNAKWGTPDPVLVEDCKYRIALPVRAYGSYGFAVEDSCRFLARLLGRLPAFTEKTLGAHFKGVIITRAKDAIASVMSEDGTSILNIGTRLNEISAELGKTLSADFADYGVSLRLFMVNSISADESDPSVAQLRKALAKKAEMDIIGYSYAQERSFDALQTAAGNEGAAGSVMGAGIGIGLGAGVAAPIGAAMAGAGAAMAGAAATGAPGAKFCINCGAALPPGAKFCPGCGAKTV